MSETPEQIIPDEAIDSVWQGANFGPHLTEREVIRNTLLKFACGWAAGKTAHRIVAALGLAAINKQTLTKLGQKYLWACYSNGEFKDSPYQGSAGTILMDIDSQTIREVYFDKDKAIEACRANRDLAPFTFPVLDAVSPAGDGWKEHAIEFADWLAEMTEVIKESKIALYRYCNGMNEWGNYTLDDIYLEFLEHLKRTPSPSNKRV